ncbi:MAG: HesA/MoeB/ThiF family protein [Planctomycetota bacterium]|jgi:adenylyltransferase/sulfurtransferase
MAFTIRETDRYDRLRLLEDCDPERLAQATLCIVGVGALGNEVAKNCALLGIGRLILLDRDTVAISNLTRSVLFRAEDAGRPKAEVAGERLRELNPDVHVDVIVGELAGALGLALLRRCDAVFGCVDSREARVTLNAMAIRAAVPVIDGALGDLSGTVRVFAGAEGPCYECGLTQVDWQVLSARQPCGLLGQAAVSEGRTPTTPMSASTIGAFQTAAALKILRGDLSDAGTAVVWNGRGPMLYRTKLPALEECMAHDEWPEPEPVDCGPEATAADLLAAVGLESGVIRLTREWVAAATCVECNVTTPLGRPWEEVHREGRAAACPDCSGLREPEVIREIGADSPHAGVTLGALGYAPQDVVQVAAGEAERFAGLAR